MLPSPQSTRLFSGTFIGLLACLGVFIVAGCRKHSPGSDVPAAWATAETSSANIAAVSNSPSYTPPAPPAGADGGVDLKALNHAYIGWIVHTHQRPKTFEAFVAASGIAVPPAPAGKKYVIDKSGFITLINQ